MKKNASVTKFNFSFSILFALGKKLETLTRRDLEILLSYGITAGDIERLQQKRIEIEEIPSDEEYMGILKSCTAEKDKYPDLVKVNISSVMVRVGDTFGENSGIYTRFGTSGLSKLNDNDLLVCDRRVIRQINANLPALQAKGFTNQLLEETTSLSNQYGISLGLQEDAKLARETATEERVSMANDFYDEIMRICEFGKDYWYTRNEAKYSEYVIYNTSSGTKEDNENPGNPA